MRLRDSSAPVDELLLHFAAEMAQPEPMWPPNMLDKLSKRCSLAHLETVRFLICYLGTLRIAVWRWSWAGIWALLTLGSRYM